MLQRDAETDMFEYCTRHGMGVVAYSPMQKGLLTGKYNPQTVAQMAPTTTAIAIRISRGAAGGEPEVVDRLRPIAERNKRTLSHLAIAWVLRRPR